ncbi:MAG: mechanosensitive ion channel family protein [Balneola sp.]|nr:MAG: mechanosensitive ion channel family protein [Balneola sp.]
MKRRIVVNVLLVLLLIFLAGTDVFAQDSLSVAQSDTSEVRLSVQSEIGSFRDFFSFTKILSALIVLIATYFISRFLSFLLSALAETRPSYRLIIKRLAPFINIALWSFAIFIVIAGIIAPPIETILTVGASIGLAVGFASQDILKNIFGGFIIILDRPFQVGDKIEVSGHYGEVTDIGLRSTRIVTPDDSLISLPNADIVNNAVSNSNSGALDCQVVTSIYLPFDVSIPEVKAIAYKAAVSSKYTFLKKPIAVIAKNEVHEQNFVVHLKVKVYVIDIRYEFLLMSEITELVLGELNRKGILIREAKPQKV